MKKIYVLSFLMLALCWNADAQSKVFKEVNEEISTSMEPIMQDGALMGYLAFTQLEKVNEDSFSYKISIMDENLNDIGTINFREEDISLQSVAFEEDVLCLAYLKSNILGKTFKNKKAFKEANDNKRNSVMLQFLNLDGKIINTQELSVNIPINFDQSGYIISKGVATGGLKKSIQLTNIPQKGFACFYSDENDNVLNVYNPAGQRLWRKKLATEALYVMQTTTDDVYMLTRQSASQSSAYVISSYGVADSAEHISRYSLKNKDGNFMEVNAFSKDPSTGRPYISGTLIKYRGSLTPGNGKGLNKGTFTGLYSIDFTGNNESGIKENASIWSDASKAPEIEKNGRFLDNRSFFYPHISTRDFNGNTYFTGSAIIKRPRIGAIIGSVVTAPLLMGFIWISSTGTNKYKVRDAMVVKLDPKGRISYENSIDCNSSSFYTAWQPIYTYDTKRFFSVSNSATKSNYVVVDDTKDIVIYNITGRKVVRTLKHKEGKSRLNIYPAKEGHIMVSEYNKKEKYTRLSIEAL